MATPRRVAPRRTTEDVFGRAAMARSAASNGTTVLPSADANFVRASHSTDDDGTETARGVQDSEISNEDEKPNSTRDSRSLFERLQAAQEEKRASEKRRVFTDGEIGEDGQLLIGGVVQKLGESDTAFLKNIEENEKGLREEMRTREETEIHMFRSERSHLLQQTKLAEAHEDTGGEPSAGEEPGSSGPAAEPKRVQARGTDGVRRPATMMSRLIVKKRRTQTPATPASERSAKPCGKESTAKSETDANGSPRPLPQERENEHTVNVRKTDDPSTTLGALAEYSSDSSSSSP